MKSSAVTSGADSAQESRKDTSDKNAAAEAAPKKRPVRKRRTASRAAGDKSATAFRTISEVAEELGVQQHVLRFWETKFAQIKPLKRGGGRRYYRPENVELLKQIHQLLYVQGYTIKGVQRLLKNNRGTLLPEEAMEEESVAETTAVAEEPATTKKTPPPSPQGDLLSPATFMRTELQKILRELKGTRELLSDRGF